MVKIRRAYEVLFLGLFLFFLLITDLRYLKGWPVSLFLEATPLVAVATALTTHTIYRNLVWGLVIIAITMMLGRVWCNWMCPFGILHHLFGWIGNRRNTKQMIEVNRYRKIYAIKYYILAAMLAMASLWIDPDGPRRPGQDLAARTTGTELQQTGVAARLRGGRHGHRPGGRGAQAGQQLAPDRPARPDRADGPVDDDQRPAHRPQGDREHLHRAPRILAGVGRRPDLHRLPGGQLVDSRGSSAGRSARWGRLLGVFSRFSLWRIDRDPVRCTDCDLCLKSCEGASDPQADLRKSECFVCLNCIEDCPHDALSFRFLPRKASEVTYPAVGRRAAASWPGCSACSSSRWPGSRAGCGRTSAGRVIRPAGLGRRGRVPPPLHQVRPVHPRLPDQRPPAGHVRGRASRGSGRRS